MVKVGIIGYGYWGPNLFRNFNETLNAQVVCVCDLKTDRISIVKHNYPTIKVTNDHRELISDKRIDAVVIATPVSTHFELAMLALKAGKHVLIEKPLAATSEEYSRLIDEAGKRKLVLLVDHTFIYTGAVKKIHELTRKNLIGNIYYYDSVRINLGIFQHDVNVIWDLAVHDISVMDYLLKEKPYGVSATGGSHVKGKPEDVAYMTLFFAKKLIAHLHVNWLSPVKVRRTLIGGTNKMIVYDDLEPSDKVKVYDRGIAVHEGSEAMRQILVSYHSGDMWAPYLDVTEGLRAEVEHFADCIENMKTPITNGESGLRVVKILEAANKSMEKHGRPVKLK